MNEVRKLLESRFPGLHARIGQTLVEAEARYNRQTKQAPSEFLLEHAQRTAAIAHKLARACYHVLRKQVAYNAARAFA